MGPILLALGLALVPALGFPQQGSQPGSPPQLASKTAPPIVAASGNGSSALPADWPLRRDADSGSPGAVGYLLWLVPVVGALAVLGRFQIRRGRRPAWLMKFRDDSPRVLLKVIAAVPLGSGNSLQIVQWGGEELLLGCTGQTINLLKSRAAAASVDSASHARSATAAGCPEKS